MKKVKVTPKRRIQGECFFCRRDMDKESYENVGTPYYLVLVPVISRSGRTTGEGKFTMVCSPCVAERELREKAKAREQKGAKA